MSYIERVITEKIRQAALRYPVVAITGARQVGKSTLLRKIYPDVPYVSLEDPDVRTQAMQDPRGFLGGANRLIIDEVQVVPELFSYIQGIVDNRGMKGMFILSGSSHFDFVRGLSQSLAGRVALFELSPLSVAELSGGLCGNLPDVDVLMLSGLYPGIWTHTPDARVETPSAPDVAMYYRNYIATYLNRDLYQIVNVRDMSRFNVFLKLCAARVGSLLNATELSNEVGVSHNTVVAWLSVLEGSYILFLLRPFYRNTKKRLVKAPKLYFYDVGLAAALLGIGSADRMALDPMRGHLFENLVIAEFLKKRMNGGLTNDLAFYRDSTGNEVDLLFPGDDRESWNAVEIKSSCTYRPDFVRGLDSFSRAFPDIRVTPTVVYAGSQEQLQGKYRILRYTSIDNIV